MQSMWPVVLEVRLVVEVVQCVLSLLASPAVDQVSKVLAVNFVLAVLLLGACVLVVLSRQRRPKQKKPPGARRREPADGPSGPGGGTPSVKRSRKREEHKQSKRRATPARAPGQQRTPGRRRGRSFKAV